MQNRTDATGPATGDGNRVSRIYNFLHMRKLKSKVNPHASHTSHAITTVHTHHVRERSCSNMGAGHRMREIKWWPRSRTRK